MVRRRGIGATAAAVVIFSIVLASNLALYSAAQDRARLYEQSDAASSIAAEATVLTAGEAATVLAGVAEEIGSRTIDCAGATAAMGAIVGNFTGQQEEGGVAVTMSASLARAGTLPDNLSMLQGFDGSVNGDLNLLLSVEAAGSLPSLGIEYKKAETHLVHLSARPLAAAADCTRAVKAITESLATAPPANCTDEGLATVFEEATLESSSVAEEGGFAFSLRYAVTSMSACEVAFSVSVVQPDVPSPVGNFTLRMLGQGLVSV